MSRTFVYASVSSLDQNPENQIREIEAAGIYIEPHLIISETISGSMAIAQRQGFPRLLDKIEKGDVLIVTELDRLGRDDIDVSSPVAKLEEFGYSRSLSCSRSRRSNKFSRKDDHACHQRCC